MNYLLKSALLSAMILPAAYMQAADPDITMRTNIYDTAGPNNACTITLGGTPGKYIEVDCGFGPVEYQIQSATFDQTTQTIKGTNISCQVSKEGLIKIYTDEDAVIDYLDTEGCGLEWIDIVDPSSLQIVNFNHNSLQKLDLSDYSALQMAYLSDNPYSESPLVIGKNHPELALLEINSVYNLDPEFDINTYPKLTVFDAFAVPDIKKLTPSGCPGLVRLSIDCTNVSELDLSNNPSLAILNISETAITDIDLSKCTNLQELYVVHQSGTYNPDVKLKSLDVTMLPKLYYLFATGNEIETLDVSKNPELNHLWVGYNRLRTLDISNNKKLVNLHLEKNYFDFVTLPADRQDFIEYEYLQNPFAVPVELEVGKPLDVTKYIDRPNTTTQGRLVRVTRENPFKPEPVDESLYSFANGKLTVNQALTDSVYLELANSDFTLVAQPTSKFKVKTAAEMGKPDVKMTFQPGTSQGAELAMCIGIDGATAESPKTLYVTQGDGKTSTYQVTTSAMPSEPNVKLTAAGYGQTSLAVDVAEQITAVGIDGVTMYACDITPMSALRELRLTGTELYALDLGYNRCLEKLVLNGNHLTKIDLDGVSGDFAKTNLSYIDLAGNETAELVISRMDGVTYFDLHNNKLTSQHFKDAERIEYLDVSQNLLESLEIGYLISLRELNASDNKLTSYAAPETNVIEKADFSRNCFTYANLPARNGLSEDNFKYAPQAKIVITSKAPGIDLGTQAVTIDGAPVEFAWFKTDGTQLTAGTDYTITEGRTRFLDPTVGAEIYCAMTCASLPAFSGDNALMTTNVEAAEMPQHVVAEFSTADAGTLEMSLAADAEATSIYFDWNGDGTDLVQYVLGTSYRIFTGEAKAGKNVKVLSYNEQNGVTVFSISGVKLNSFDGTNLKQVHALTVADTGLESITYPDTDKIRELNISGNAFTEFDATKFPELFSISLTGNKLTTLDLTPCDDVEVVAAARNQLTDIKFKENNKVYFLDITGNKFESYDLQQHKMLNQVGLAQNLLTTVDPSNLPDLRVIALDGNRFTFATLPLPESHWSRYTYANQATIVPEIDGLTIDLSSQKQVAETPTVYRWFIGMPTYNQDLGDFEGEELVAGEEYTIENGVTTLNQGYNKMICLMTNSELPNVVLTTDLLDLSALETIEAEGVDAEAAYFTLDGLRVANPSQGIYIVVRGNKVTKELIK